MFFFQKYYVFLVRVCGNPGINIKLNGGGGGWQEAGWFSMNIKLNGGGGQACHNYVFALFLCI